MTAAIDVVRNGFAAMEAGDMATASATFAPSLVYRLHGGHPLAGTFDGKQAALGAMAALAQAGGDVATILRVEDDAITEIVSVSSRALDTYWSSTT